MITFVTPEARVNAARLEAQAADDAWQAELVAIFGAKASEVRYTPDGQSTPRLAALHAAWRSASQRHHDAWAAILASRRIRSLAS